MVILAPEHGLVNLAETFERLKQISFCYRPEIMDQLLADTPPGAVAPTRPNPDHTHPNFISIT